MQRNAGKNSVSEGIAIAKEAGLEGIEWWGNVHVPHGNTVVYAKVKALPQSPGLEVTYYGSYYRPGVSEAEGLSFSTVLDTAIALGAPTIRIWAGNRNYADPESFTPAVLFSTDSARSPENPPIKSIIPKNMET